MIAIVDYGRGNLGSALKAFRRAGAEAHLWSDPAATGGLVTNEARGVGLLFGPDVTDQFCRENDVQLVLRSHEGPDARADRDDGLARMMEGYTVDHVGPHGTLATVFSAPDYPQFQETEIRSNNLGAVAVLSGPNWTTPRFVTYQAMLPRPAAQPYYEIDRPGSDDEGPEVGGGVPSDFSLLEDPEMGAGGVESAVVKTDTEVVKT